MASEGRVQKVASEIKKSISMTLRTRIKDSKLALATISEVEMSKDLSHAKVYYTSLNDRDLAYIAKTFDKSVGFFRSSIAKTLKLRIVPTLKFIYDDSLNYGLKMEQKISKALDDDASFIKQDQNLLDENYKSDNDDLDIEFLR